MEAMVVNYSCIFRSLAENDCLFQTMLYFVYDVVTLAIFHFLTVFSPLFKGLLLYLVTASSDQKTKIF